MGDLRGEEIEDAQHPLRMHAASFGESSSPIPRDRAIWWPSRAWAIACAMRP